MKTKDIRQKKKSELEKLLGEKRGHLQKLRFSLVRKEVKNVKEVSQTRRDIAKILTIMNDHEQNKPTA